MLPKTCGTIYNRAVPNSLAEIPDSSILIRFNVDCPLYSLLVHINQFL